MSFEISIFTLINSTKMEMQDDKCDASTSTHLYPNLELAPQQPSPPNMYNASVSGATTLFSLMLQVRDQSFRLHKIN
jgi:hypothetical protein